MNGGRVMHMADRVDKESIRDRVELTNPEELYAIRDKDGRYIDIESANGRELFNHYRHRMTNYDEVLDDVRDLQDGNLTGRQEKAAAVAASEEILSLYRDEHLKVIKDSQKKGSILKLLMQKAGVGTASALSNFLDSCSDRLKDIAHLESSRRSLQVWNDAYRVQRVLVKEALVRNGASQETIDAVNQIYGTRSVNKAIEKGVDLFELEKAEIAKMVKSAVRYTIL